MDEIAPEYDVIIAGTGKLLNITRLRIIAALFVAEEAHCLML
jgi:hypothetical protein